jgi:acylphosphatase
MSITVVQHLSITGQVRGVGYRIGLMRESTRLGVGRSVRNRRDGSVEALAAGPPEPVDRLVSWARRGPPAAVVSGVAARPAPAPAPCDLPILALGAKALQDAHQIRKRNKSR